MANFLQLLALWLSVCNTMGFLFNPFFNPAFFDPAPNWDLLEVTWGIPLIQTDIFHPMPLTKQDAINIGFVPVDPANTPCANGFFLGQRYMKPNDSASIILYDKNGYICGIQSGYHQNVLKSFEAQWFQSQPMFNNDVVGNNKTYTLTAYLVKPDTICATGRTQAEFKKSHSGNGLYLQNGPNPLNNFLTIPMKESNIDTTVWTKETCILTMGQHYWHNISVNMNCNTLLPSFVMYNRDFLTGFGFVGLTNSTTYSPRFEHPPQSLLSAFFTQIPVCLQQAFNNSGGITTMHVFMNRQLQNELCDSPIGL